MKYSLYIFPLLFIFSAVSAQDYNKNFRDLYYTVGNYSRVFSPVSVNAHDIKGNPYLSPHFIQGEIRLKDGTLIDRLALRYNILMDQVEFFPTEGQETDGKKVPYDKEGKPYHEKAEYIAGDTFTISQPFEIERIRMGNRTFVYLLAIKRKSGREYLTSGYFEVISDGKLQLLVKREINIEVNSFIPYYGGGGGDGSSYFANYDKLFVRSGHGAARPFKAGRKNVIAIMGDRKEKVIQYLSDENVNLNRIADLVSVFRYYNSKADE